MLQTTIIAISSYFKKEQLNLSGIHIIAKGRVQGVGFRYHTQVKAQHLGLTGDVKNLQDASVEIHAFGESDSILALVEWCKTGPEAANVTELEFTFIEPRNTDQFVIIR